jgi:catechol 2,3-dioxygenase-like lactoylglutathione lyase family enzyme
VFDTVRRIDGKETRMASSFAQPRERSDDVSDQPRAISPAKFAHVVLRTRAKFEAMRQWYLTVLNARVVYDTGFLVFLSYDDEHHRVAIAQDPQLAERPHRSAGLDHLAFTYAGLDDLLATYERLKAAGILPFCPVNHGPTTSLYYVDPDNNRVELQVDNFTDMDAATDAMTASFGVNPVGDEFDPDDYVARRRAGESIESLLRPSANPEPPKMDLIMKLRSS